MRTGLRFGWLAIALAAGVGSASAQNVPAITKATEAQLREIHCAYVRLKEDQLLPIVENYFNPTDDNTARAKLALESGITPCKATYKWPDRKTEIAREVTTHDGVIEVLQAALADLGFSDDAALSKVWIGLSREDHTFLLNAGSDEQDEAFLKRMRPVLLKAGLPDDDDAIGAALTILESTTVIEQRTQDWLNLG